MNAPTMRTICQLTGEKVGEGYGEAVFNALRDANDNLTKLASLTAQRDEARAETDAAMSNVRDLGKQVERLTSAAAQWQADRDEWRERAEEFRDRYERAETRSQELEAENAALRAAAR